MSHGVPRGGGDKPATEQDRKREAARISDYKGLVDSVHARIHTRQLDVETLDLTSKLLTWNPEYYTIWNHRRLIIQRLLSEPATQEESGNLPHKMTASRITDDLAFLLPLLRKFPKCYWIWNYRLWLLGEATSRLPTHEAPAFWQQELMLASKMLSLDSRNFQGWGYRRTVVAALESMTASSDDAPSSIIQNEFDYTTKMINANLSNFSAWHNRSKLIPKLLNERQAEHKTRCKFLEEELKLIQRALWTDADDQSLWFYHHFLICNLDPKYISNSMVPDLTKAERSEYLIQETERIEEMLEDAEDCRWVYQALILLNNLRSISSEDAAVVRTKIRYYVDRLLTLDPLRRGRWIEMEQSL